MWKADNAIIGTNTINSIHANLLLRSSFLFIAAKLYEPVLVQSSKKVYDQLGIPEEDRNYEKVYDFGGISGFKVVKGDQLFPRLDTEIEVGFIQELMNGNK